MSHPIARFTQTPVVDADAKRVGTVIGTELSENTRELRRLLISLDPDIQERSRLDQESIWLDVEQVQAIRRSELQLARPIHALLDDPTDAVTAIAPDGD